MNKKTKALLIAMIALVLIAVAVITFALIQLLAPEKETQPQPAPPPDPATIVRSPAITGELSYDSVPNERDPLKGLIGTLCADGYPIAYDETSKTYYLSVADSDIGQKTGIAFSVLDENGEETLSLAFQDEKIDRHSYFTPENDRYYRLRAYDKHNFEDASICITTMPFLTIETKDGAVINNDTDCTVTLRNGNWKTDGGALVTTSCATIRLRGATSRNFDKKPYRLSLKQSDYETNRALSLLGLRNDDDWILDAMYVDPTRMHNKVSTEIWNEMTEGANASTGRYVEVILNGKYVGVYDLIEPVDRKQLDLDRENGLLIKSKGWVGTYFDKTDGYPTGERWMDFYVKYPDEPIDENTWGIFYDLVETTVNYEEDPEAFAQMAIQSFDHDNLTNYWLWLTAFSLRDNRGKNLYWSCEDITDPDAKYIITPWDCDIGYGYRYGHNDKSPLHTPVYRDEYENDYIDDFDLLTHYIEADVNNAKDTIREKWETLSAEGGVLSLQSVLDRMDGYYDYLCETGAWDREMMRWPAGMNEDPEEEFEYLHEWMTDRYEWMEERIEEVCE